MDKLIIEKATEEWDLPHAYKADSGTPGSDCRCGRTQAHELHSPASHITEKAAAPGPALITEKGI